MQRGGWLLLLLLSFLACSSHGGSGAGNSAGDGPTADNSAGDGSTADNSAGNGPTADNSAGNGSTAGNQTPTPTDQGTSLGEKLTQTIGASGGTVSSADGRLTLTFPRGALDTDTEIGIEPITNTAPLGVGTAYRLTPDGATFPKPITVTFNYTPEDLSGSSTDALFIGYQSSDGFWHTLGSPTVDTTNLTVSNPQGHFTDVSMLLGWQLRPGDATLAPLESLDLKLQYCEPDRFAMQDDELAALTYRCDLDNDLPRLVNVTGWAVNGTPGGSAEDGYVMGHGQSATYQAPSIEPTNNPVAVSVSFTHGSAKTMAVSNLLIGPGGWSGTVSWTLSGDDMQTDTTASTMETNGWTVSGSGTIKVISDPVDGMPLVQSAMATYHYVHTRYYHTAGTDPSCMRDVVQNSTETLDGTTTDTTTAGIFIYGEPGSGIAQIMVSVPSGPTNGNVVTDATETDTGSGLGCVSSTGHTDNPFMDFMPSDTFGFQATYAMGGVKGTILQTIDGTEPSHKYQINYDLVLK